MGNCLKRESSSSSMVWAEDEGDEWEWTSPEKIIPERDSLLGGDKNNNNASFSSSSSSSSSSGELKIVISKKQLEQLLRKGDETMHDVAVDQILARLLVDVGGSEMLRQRSWRPRLQSIPEVN